MRKYIMIIATLLSLQGCIKSALLNPEADILSFSVDPNLLTGQTFINESERKIELFLTGDAYTNGILPKIEITNGAHISPAPGDSIHFENGPISYTITSEDGINKRTYVVEVVNVGNWNFDFENWAQNSEDKYELPVESNQSFIWSSGNQGVALSGVPKEVLSYPTRSTADGYLGTKGAEMVTIKGTELSAFLGIYLYAGSLFIGDFNPSVVLINPLQATEFGEPYIGLPDRFTGYYKYTPGPQYQDENQNIVAGKIDECSVYAVLFQGPERLDGSNIETSDRIIATAKLSDGTAKSAFTKFDIPFVYKAGIPTNPSNLLMTIVASSSKDGSLYKGALGSKLIVDSLSIIPK